MLDQPTSSGSASGQASTSVSSSLSPPPPTLALTTPLYSSSARSLAGSWFTLERWITPHPFEGTSAQSELSLCQSLPSSILGPRLLQHWQSFVTEEDFRWLAQKGVNTLRLPVSYYHLAGLDPSLLNGTPYEPFKDIYTPAWELITRAITLARSRGLGVLLDLHGVPGGQNDDAHSGQDGPARLWEEKSWRVVTGRCLERVVKELREVENVVGSVLPLLLSFFPPTFHPVCARKN